MNKYYTCPTHPHHNTLKRGTAATCDYCPDCMQELQDTANPAYMTDEARQVEFLRWFDQEILSVPFGDMVDRLAALLGRPIYTHELATTTRAQFIAEFVTDIHPSLEDTVDELHEQFPHLKENTIRFNPDEQDD